jgi:hypothetical protein
MANDAYKLVDVENATNRFPLLDVYEYVNKGIARVYAAMLQAWDRPFYITEAFVQVAQMPPPGSAFTFPLPVDYLQLVGLGFSSSQLGPYRNCEPYQSDIERTELMTPGYGSGIHFHYGFAAAPTAFTQGIPATTYSLDVVPNPPLSSWFRVRYVPSPQRLVNAQDAFDGILGFEDAAVTWAAILMRRKDDLDTGALEGDYAQHMTRVTSIARRRDRSRPPKTTIVAGWGRGAGRRR